MAEFGAVSPRLSPGVWGKGLNLLWCRGRVQVCDAQRAENFRTNDESPSLMGKKITSLWRQWDKTSEVAQRAHTKTQIGWRPLLDLMEKSNTSPDQGNSFLGEDLGCSLSLLGRGTPQHGSGEGRMEE